MGVERKTVPGRSENVLSNVTEYMEILERSLTTCVCQEPCKQGRSPVTPQRVVSGGCGQKQGRNFSGVGK